MSAPSDRREFPRLKAHVLCRPTGARLLRREEPAQDISLGGLRVYSDDEAKVGDALELELLLQSGESIECRSEVAWIEALPPSAPARFDVGLRFTNLSAAARATLQSMFDSLE